MVSMSLIARLTASSEVYSGCQAHLLLIATPEPALGEILPLHFTQGQNDRKRRGSQ